MRLVPIEAGNKSNVLANRLIQSLRLKKMSISSDVKLIAVDMKKDLKHILYKPIEGSKI